MNPISIPEASLSSRAMLCSLSISMWSARKHDPEASEEIAQRHGAQADAGRYHKVLLPKEALAEIHKIVSEARQEHYFMTLPWDDNGYRVLPAAAYMDHTGNMRELSNRFTPAVEALAQQFGRLVEEAKARLGGLFRVEDYPAPDDLRSKFSFETKVMPLPDAGDFRVALGDEEKERIKRQITAPSRPRCRSPAGNSGSGSTRRQPPGPAPPGVQGDGGGSGTSLSGLGCHKPGETGRCSTQAERDGGPGTRTAGRPSARLATGRSPRTAEIGICSYRDCENRDCDL